MRCFGEGRKTRGRRGSFSLRRGVSQIELSGLPRSGGAESCCLRRRTRGLERGGKFGARQLTLHVEVTSHFCRQKSHLCQGRPGPRRGAVHVPGHVPTCLPVPPPPSTNHPLVPSSAARVMSPMPSRGRAISIPHLKLVLPSPVQCHHVSSNDISNDLGRASAARVTAARGPASSIPDCPTPTVMHPTRQQVPLRSRDAPHWPSQGARGRRSDGGSADLLLPLQTQPRGRHP